MLTPNYTGPWLSREQSDPVLRQVARDSAYAIRDAYESNHERKQSVDGVCFVTKARVDERGALIGYYISFAGVTQEAFKSGYSLFLLNKTAVPGTIVFTLKGSVSVADPKKVVNDLLGHLTEQVYDKLLARIPAIYAGQTRGSIRSDSLVLSDTTASALFRTRLAMREIGSKVADAIRQVIEKEIEHRDRHEPEVFNEADTSLLDDILESGIDRVMSKFGFELDYGKAAYSIVRFLKWLLEDRKVFRILASEVRARTALIDLVKAAFTGTLTKNDIYGDPNLMFSANEREYLANGLIPYPSELVYGDLRAQTWLMPRGEKRILLPFMTPDILAETVIIVGKLNKSRFDRVHHLSRMLAPQIAAKNAADGW